MSNPVITNRAPAPRTVGGVQESVRFSVRDQDDQALRTTVQFYLGYGTAWWEGGVLPEDEERASFILRSRTGAPSNPALRSLDGDQLLLEKLVPAALQEAMYEFGGLDSPTAYDSPLMFEFELTVDGADVVVDAQSWTGVFAGIKAFNKGVAIKLVDDGTKKIEIHSADPAVAIPTYTVNYDWDQSTSHLFKLLWHPQLDLMRLFVSTGPDALTSDVLLIDGTVSAFSDLPSDEIPAVQPVGFFGHGSFNATSKSRWSAVYLYHEVTKPVANGTPTGGHTGYLLSDEVVTYLPIDLPRKVSRPWLILPDSFGLVGGDEEISTEGHLILRRSSYAHSFGFYRVEPKVVVGPTIVDFRVWGRVSDRPPGAGAETGMEIYIDDGIKKAVVELLQAGTQSVGLQGIDSAPSGWAGPKQYRLVCDPAGGVKITYLDDTDDGRLEATLVGAAYSSLPASDLPGPGVGFLHNANSAQARGELFVSEVKYSTNIGAWESSTGVPVAPWSAIGLEPYSIEGDFLLIADDADGGGINDVRSFAVFDPLMTGRGFFCEAVCAVDSYEKSGVLNPPRSVVGAGIVVEDGVDQFPLVFADGGPELGKIAFLALYADVDQNLIDIRAQREAVAGTYFSVDWSLFHHYRMERTINGNLSVFLDHSPVPSIRFGFREVELNTGPSTFVLFGSLLSDRKTTTRWQSVRYGLSHGWDVESLPKVDELRYDNAINSIVEVDS